MHVDSKGLTLSRCNNITYSMLNVQTWLPGDNDPPIQNHNVNYETRNESICKDQSLTESVEKHWRTMGTFFCLVSLQPILVSCCKSFITKDAKSLAKFPPPQLVHAWSSDREHGCGKDKVKMLFSPSSKLGWNEFHLALLQPCCQLSAPLFPITCRAPLLLSVAPWVLYSTVCARREHRAGRRSVTSPCDQLISQPGLALRNERNATVHGGKQSHFVPTGAKQHGTQP